MVGNNDFFLTKALSTAKIYSKIFIPKFVFFAFASNIIDTNNVFNIFLNSNMAT